MHILNDFSDLTSFVHEEFMKMRQAYGLGQMNAKDLSHISKTVLNSFHFANATTKRKLKYYAKIDWAIFTAPHNWLWRFFHKKLWLKCQEEIERRKENKNSSDEEECNAETLAPEISPVDMSALSLTSSTTNHLLDNFD